MDRPAAALALLAVLLGGCAGHPGQPSAPAESGGGGEVHWGLGLDTSAPTPPAPLAEDPAGLAHLFAFANASIEAVLHRCPTESQESWVTEAAANAEAFRAFGELIDACDSLDRAALRIEADRAAANGTEAALVAREVRAADDAIARLRPALHAMPAPGTVVDAEFQGFLETYFAEVLNSRGFGQESWQAYLDHRGESYDDLNLATSLANLAGARRAAEALQWFAQQYGWQAGRCDLPTLAAERARVFGQYNGTLALARERGKPEDAEYGSNLYGYLPQVLYPRIVNMSREGLLLGLFDTSLDFQRAYWANATRTTLPTVDEAHYLLALHRSKVWSLRTQDTWRNERQVLESSAPDWEERPDRALRPLALQAVQWPYARLHCSPAAS
jgi:hypothetical protein